MQRFSRKDGMERSMKFKGKIIKGELTAEEARKLESELRIFISSLCKYIKLSDATDDKSPRKIIYECPNRATHNVVWNDYKAISQGSETYKVYCEAHAERIANKMNKDQEEMRKKQPNVISPQLKSIVRSKKGARKN
jgi:hypothetical protein